MSSCENFIQKLKETLPPLCTAKHLVEAGLYSSPQAVAMARYAGKSPEYFKIGGAIKFPREGVINFLDLNKHETDSSKSICTAQKVKSVSEQSGLANDREP
jgi:hypothetical protein